MPKPRPPRTLRNVVIAAVLLFVAFIALTLWLAMPVIHRAGLSWRLGRGGLGGLHGGEWSIGSFPIILKGQTISLVLPRGYNLNPTDIELLSGMKFELLRLDFESESAENFTRLARVIAPAGKYSVLAVIDPNFGDEHMRAIAGWTDLRELELHGSNVTPAGYAHLAGLTSLESVDIRNPTHALDNEAVTHLNKLPDGVKLRIVIYSLTSDRLAPFAQLRRKTLLAVDMSLTDADLAHLAEVPLSGLEVTGPGITDASMPMFARFEKLEGLGLSNSSVTDAGLVYLSGLENLSYLDLSKTAITDAGLVHLAKLPKLRYLDVPPAVTEQGLRDAFGERRDQITVHGQTDAK